MSPDIDSREGFLWRGERLVYPRSMPDAEGRERPLAEATALEFCEVSDLCRAGALRYLPLIAAILCRPEGEAYEERKAIARAGRMGKLPEDVAGRILDMVAGAHLYLRQEYPECYAGKMLRDADAKGEGREGRTQGEAFKGRNAGMAWGGLLLSVAGFVPSEVRVAERMNCYDFMRLACMKIRCRAFR